VRNNLSGPRRNMHIIFCLWILCTITNLNAATTSGTLERDEVWEGVIEITGDVIVPDGITLTIKPNALIKFSANRDDQAGGYDVTKSELIIEGVLRAEGRNKYEIRFTSSNFVLPVEDIKAKTQPQAGDWYGIIFIKGDHDRSIVSNSVIEFAYDGITCINASPRIYRNRIEGNYWNGILCDVVSAPKISSNQIVNNGYSGINCKIRSAPIITGNEVSGNRYGILIQDISTPVIGDTRLAQNTGKNTIYNNLEFNLYNHTKNVIYAQRNDWGDNTNADRMIRDDDESLKAGFVVFTPVYTSGKVSFQELKSLSVAENKDEQTQKEQQKKELETLKKKIEEKKTTVGEVAIASKGVSKEDEKKRREEEEKEKERVRLLEEQAKQEEQIKLEQEKQLALQKQKEEDLEKQKVAAAAKAKASTFVPTKMANELDNNPKPVSKVTPIMPDLARNAKINGTLLLRVLVGITGLPEEIYISKKIGNKDFDQIINDAAITAVKQWVFEQGISGGQPAKYWTVVSVIMK